MATMNLENPKRWIKEREAIRTKREAGLPAPWTNDPILTGARFCNVRREDDSTTRWIAANWRGPHADNPDLHFAMAVARFVNHPDSLAEIGFPVPWDPELFKRVLCARVARGEKVFGPAYVIGNGGKSKPKIDYIAEDILTPLWRYRGYWRPASGEKLATVIARLRTFEGFAGFMDGQVIADLKYVEPLLSAPDWFSFVSAGPGSKEGLARIIGKPADYEWGFNPGWLPTFREFELEMRPWLKKVGLGDLHCQDLQNCLCEIGKYWRILEGGKPKQLYRPPVVVEAAE